MTNPRVEEASDASESRTPSRRNDTSRLVREIKRRLHARSRPVYSPLPLLLLVLLLLRVFLLVYSFFSVCPVLRVSTSTTQSRAVLSFAGRAANTSHAGRMFYAIGGHYRISSCPPLSRRANDCAARRYIPAGIRARMRYPEPQAPSYRR